MSENDNELDNQHPNTEGYVDPRTEATGEKLSKFSENQRLAYLLNATAKQLMAITEKTAIHDLGEGVDIDNYLRAAGEGQQNGWADGQFDGVFEREGSKWVQVVEADGERMAISKPGLSLGSDTKISGDTAQFLAREALGKGSMIQLPLWRSGIWVTLKTPKLVDLVELDQRLKNSKVNLGRELSGNIFSNQMVYSMGILFDFALDHIYTTTLKSRRKDDMRQLILSTDLMQLMNGLTASIYPKGYPFDQACVANIETCQHVSTAMINLVKLSWTDRSALTDEQLRHMANREARYTTEDIKSYQNKHQQGYSTTRDLTDNFRIVFKEPSVERYLRAGYEWIESIEASCERVFDKDISSGQRNNYIEKQATKSAMRRWSHWIDKFVIGDKEVTEPATIGQIVSDNISPDAEYRDIMSEAVRELIDKSTITVIGVPKYTCPGCGTEPEGHPIYPQLMAVNPVTSFLSLSGQQLTSLIDER